MLGHLYCNGEKYEWVYSDMQNNFMIRFCTMGCELKRTDNLCTVVIMNKKRFRSHYEDKGHWESLFTEMMHHEICRKIIIQNTFVISNPPIQWRRKRETEQNKILFYSFFGWNAYSHSQEKCVDRNSWENVFLRSRTGMCTECTN